MALHHDDVTAAFKRRRAHPEEYDQYVSPETYEELIEILGSAEIQVRHQLMLYDEGLSTNDERDTRWYARAHTVARLYRKEVERLKRLVTQHNVNQQTKFGELKRRYKHIVKLKEEDILEWKQLVLELADFIDELDGDLEDFVIPTRTNEKLTLYSYYRFKKAQQQKEQTP